MKIYKDSGNTEHFAYEVKIRVKEGVTYDKEDLQEQIKENTEHLRLYCEDIERRSITFFNINEVLRNLPEDTTND